LTEETGVQNAFDDVAVTFQESLLRGYMTKYDCSAADVNPIGGISKGVGTDGQFLPRHQTQFQLSVP
jgi:hypothetical protein